ncbi:hypothetical protein [Candidatus Accumulibacter sp. ACC003]|uniref:hypothetical protein n=1 Tax=Candidatus Accumulibacter sp. ACC003 TaxID=2823334 RepID=UPI0025BCEB1B|nr:hypothetical protein [Candidatus Accumulibacter sp. ACC003]
MLLAQPPLLKAKEDDPERPFNLAERAGLAYPEVCLAVRGKGCICQARGHLPYAAVDRWQLLPARDHPYE